MLSAAFFVRIHEIFKSTKCYIIILDFSTITFALGSLLLIIGTFEHKKYGRNKVSLAFLSLLWIIIFGGYTYMRFS